MSDSWPGDSDFDTRLKWTFFLVYFRLSPLKHVRKVVSGFGKEVVKVLVWKARKHMCVTDCHDMTIGVKVALNPNTINQSIYRYIIKRYTRFIVTSTSLIGFAFTLSQTTNFVLLQIERVCRRQFKISWKWRKVLEKGRKHCGKRRNCSQWAVSPLPAVVSKDLYCRHVKTRACLGKG